MDYDMCSTHCVLCISDQTLCCVYIYFIQIFVQDILAGKYDHLPEGAFYMVS